MSVLTYRTLTELYPAPTLDNQTSSLYFLSKHTTLANSAKPTSRTVEFWPEGAFSQLQDCFTQNRIYICPSDEPGGVHFIGIVKH